LIADAHARAAQISFSADQMALHWLALARANSGLSAFGFGVSFKKFPNRTGKPSFRCSTNGKFFGMGIDSPLKTPAS
jgi:hypothetical protein